MATDTPAARPKPPDFGIATPMPPARAQIFDVSSALTRRLSAADAVVVRLDTLRTKASLWLWIVLIETDPPSAKDPAAAPATVMLLMLPL